MKAIDSERTQERSRNVPEIPLRSRLMEWIGSRAPQGRTDLGCFFPRASRIVPGRFRGYDKIYFGPPPLSPWNSLLFGSCAGARSTQPKATIQVRNSVKCSTVVAPASKKIPRVPFDQGKSAQHAAVDASSQPCFVDLPPKRL